MTALSIKPPNYKIVIVGNTATGKTSLIRRYTQNKFESYHSTIAIDFSIKTIENIANLQLWDVGGEERFGTATHVFYRQAVAAIIVFDVTKQETLDGALRWKEDIRKKLEDPIPILLVANKIDALTNPRAPSTEDLEAICQAHGFIGYVDASAKSGVGVEKAFETLLVHLEILSPQPKEGTVTLTSSRSSQKAQDGCC